MTKAAQMGDLRRRRVTLPQAAVMLNADVTQVRKTVDRHGLDVAYLTVGKRQIRALDGIDIIYLRLAPSFSPKMRRGLYSALKHAPDEQPLHGSIHVHVEGQPGRTSVVDVPLDRSAAETILGLDEAERAAQSISAREDGPVIRGTAVEPHRIAALADGGMSIKEILQDYPDLTAEQIDASVAYARAHPKPGRPYPHSTVKAALRAGRGGLKRAFAAASDDERPK